ncbi:MAG: undecaprenyl-diphosphate phosphatase [Gemmobacter sp.]|nr:undecaprenyl-diphosphate phosphatase [Gemmobacter sp.]
MPLLTLSLLAIVQGITEFLPISSSAHLILLHRLSGEMHEALALDVAVHLGSIVAVVLYFRTDVGRAFVGLGQILRGHLATSEAFLALCLLIATVPALVVGAVLAATGWVDALRNPVVIGVTMIVFGVWLWWAHRTSPELRAAREWRLRDAVRMGLWQSVALVPGVSRSGITITEARRLGFDRHSAAKLSMLMSVPITLATGGVLALKAAQQGISAALLGDIALGAVLAFGAAWAALSLMMRFLDRVSFTPYVVYRLALGVVLLALAVV